MAKKKRATYKVVGKKLKVVTNFPWKGDEEDYFAFLRTAAGAALYDSIAGTLNDSAVKLRTSLRIEMDEWMETFYATVLARGRALATASNKKRKGNK